MQTAGRGVVLGVMLVGLLVATTSAHMLGLGSCRDYEGMANFDPARFNGTWYVIKRLVTRSNCLTVNYNLMDDGQNFRVEEVRRPPYSDIIPIDLAVTNAGVLNRLDSPSKFSVTWYNGILPVTATLIVADTDYDTYAILYECQEILKIMNRQSASIMSRTPTMDAQLVKSFTEKLNTEFSIPSSRMNTVGQDDCIPLDANDFNLVIDEEGFKSALESYQELETLALDSPKEIVEIGESDTDPASP